MRTRRTISQKDMIRAVVAVVALILLIVGCLVVLQRWQEHQRTQTTSASQDNRKTLEYQDTTYVARDGVFR